jgi:hypothetical protein
LVFSLKVVYFLHCLLNLEVLILLSANQWYLMKTITIGITLLEVVQVRLYDLFSF